MKAKKLLNKVTNSLNYLEQSSNPHKKATNKIYHYHDCMATTNLTNHFFFFFLFTNWFTITNTTKDALLLLFEAVVPHD